MWFITGYIPIDAWKISNRKVIRKESVLSMQTKFNALTLDLVRVMRNFSEHCGNTERSTHVQQYVHRMKFSGYTTIRHYFGIPDYKNARCCCYRLYSNWYIKIEFMKRFAIGKKPHASKSTPWHQLKPSGLERNMVMYLCKF